MDRKAFFYIDDVIWVFRDLTRKRPASMFDNPFLKLMKQGHDLYGMVVQLNVFYRTDYFYGNDEFTLAEMTDAYKAEWEEASDWLKLSMHAKQEFPDYPWVNATYQDVKEVLEDVKREIYRFAGEKTFAHCVVPHWNPISKSGIQALYDGGVRLTSMTYGKAEEYDGNPFSLPYGHAGRLLQNRQPETKVYLRNTKDLAAARSLCAYNHFNEDEAEQTYLNLNTLADSETGMHFSRLSCGVCLNLNTLAEVEESIASFVGHEYIGYGTHEQYFYEDYYNYQPEYPAKILKAAEILSENGYTYFFPEELVNTPSTFEKESTMITPTYIFTGDKKIPAQVTLKEYTTPVWIQQKWEQGEYAQYIQKNGCGHCCTAMALNLNGIKINPHEEFTLCRNMWGEPRYKEPLYEDNFISASGIVKIINSFGIAAQCFGVPQGKCDEVAKNIQDMLKSGKLVIIWSSPSKKLPNNPFSPGEHYILAVGVNEDGSILIANSSARSDAKDGIQYTDRETIAKVLKEGCDPQDFTWGRYDLEHSGGYVVVG